METKKLRDYIEKRLSCDEISDIERHVCLEKKILDSLCDGVAQAITQYMCDHTMNINQLSAVLHVSPAYIKKLQKGEINLTISKMAHVCALLGYEPVITFVDLKKC